MLPTKHAAKYLKVSYAILDRLIDKKHNDGIIHFQARIDAPDGDRPTLGFAVGYLNDVLKITGSDRGQGHTVFTPQVVESLEPINKKWDKLYPIA